MSRSSPSSSLKRKRPCVIDLDDETDDFGARNLRNRTPNSDTSTSSDDDDSDEDLIVELTAEEAKDFEKRLAQRNAGTAWLDSVTTGTGVLVELNGCYELLPNEEDHEYPPFLLVKSIIKLPSDEIVVQGILMKRHFDIFVGYSRTTREKMHAILPLVKNELCMVLWTTLGKAGYAYNRECFVDIPLHVIMQKRRVVFTNQILASEGQPLPFNYQTEGLSAAGSEESRRFVEEHGVLCCRWKFIEEVDVQRRKVIAWQLTPLSEAECDEHKAGQIIVMRRPYGKIPTNKRSPGHSINRATSSRVPRRTGNFTHLDVCVGGGGALRGAEAAGLRLTFALDKWDVAIETIRTNFLQLTEDGLLLISVEDLNKLHHRLPCLRVDVLHISYPCQGHSYCNRGQNPERDFKNNALITSLESILKICKPRIVTMEQTNGILTKNDGFYFRKTISQLTAAGYGVRWKVCDMKEHKVPSARKRLMIMAFCPGQPMPEFPASTGGATVREAIADIPFHAKFHDIEAQKRSHRANRYNLPVIDIDQPLKHTIKTDGVQGLLKDERDGQYYRPTIRQQMRLMTFPDNHILAGNTQKDFTTQIGNAASKPSFRQLPRSKLNFAGSVCFHGTSLP